MKRVFCCSLVAAVTVTAAWGDVESRPGVLAVTYTSNRRQIAFQELPIRF